MNAAKKTRSKIIPVDSEHSAVFQCLAGCDKILNVIKKNIFDGFREGLSGIMTKKS